MANNYTLQQVFNNVKTTENGDIAFVSTGNKYADMVFYTEYYTKHLNELAIGKSGFDKTFAMFIRDPRFGMGMRAVGRRLMAMSEVGVEDVIKCGRFDDLLYPMRGLDYIKQAIENGNELAKKWMPRFGSSNKAMASKLAKAWGMSKQTYGKFIKVATTESRLTEHDTDSINFAQVPSQAHLKYASHFANSEDTKERYAQYLEEVRNGKSDLKVSTTSVYDIYKNCDKIDADLFFSKIEKISINALAIVDTSGSMFAQDSFGKAVAIGHYIAKCSNFMNGYAISFSSRPQLLNINEESKHKTSYKILKSDSNYSKEINNLYTGDCSNTDFGAVVRLLKNVGTGNLPQYLIVLSDMEFDQGSNTSKEELYNLWKQNGSIPPYPKIVWWNLNPRHKTAPEMDNYGNIFMSGYNPILLKYLSASFDNAKFIKKLLEEYKKKITKS